MSSSANHEPTNICTAGRAQEIVARMLTVAYVNAALHGAALVGGLEVLCSLSCAVAPCDPAACPCSHRQTTTASCWCHMLMFSASHALHNMWLLDKNILNCISSLCLMQQVRYRNAQAVTAYNMISMFLQASSTAFVCRHDFNVQDTACSAESRCSDISLTTRPLDYQTLQRQGMV